MGQDRLVLDLSDALRPALGLAPAARPPAVTGELARGAIRRHKVGALLHSAASAPQAPVKAEAQALERLRANRRHNLWNGLRLAAVERKVARMLDDRGIAYSILKGSGLAVQLYDDPSLRMAKDLDVLIAPCHVREAIGLFNGPEYEYRPYSLHADKVLPRLRQQQDIRLFKDLTFIHRHHLAPIEVHRRLFGHEPRGFTQDFNAAIGFAVTPSLGSPIYCLYLILHGALSFWHRLKWVVDLSLLLRRIGPDQMAEVLALAERYGCFEAVVSSAILAERTFPGSLYAHWSELVSRHHADPRVERLVSYYWETLSGPTDQKPRLPLRAFLSCGHADVVFPGSVGFLQGSATRWLRSLSVRY